MNDPALRIAPPGGASSYTSLPSSAFILRRSRRYCFELILEKVFESALAEARADSWIELAALLMKLGSFRRSRSKSKSRDAMDTVSESHAASSSVTSESPTERSEAVEAISAHSISRSSSAVSGFASIGFNLRSLIGCPSAPSSSSSSSSASILSLYSPEPTVRLNGSWSKTRMLSETSTPQSFIQRPHRRKTSPAKFALAPLGLMLGDVF